jgi:hypothetical protein
MPARQCVGFADEVRVDAASSTRTRHSALSDVACRRGIAAVLVSVGALVTTVTLWRIERRDRRRALDELNKAELSASLSERKGQSTRRVIIRNLGPGDAQLHNVELPDDHVIVNRSGFENGEVVDLHPNEEYLVNVTLATGYRTPIHVLLEWYDARGQQIRDQSIMPP